MKQTIIPFALVAALAAPAHAEDGGFNLMEEGAKLFFEGIMKEMAPALKELDGLSEELEPALRGFVQNFGPQMGDLLRQVEDFSKYHAPEILPNGDIILRRKLPSEMEEPPSDDIEL